MSEPTLVAMTTSSCRPRRAIQCPMIVSDSPPGWPVTQREYESAVSTRLNPASTNASRSWNDLASSAVQPNTLPPKASGATSNPVSPSLRRCIAFAFRLHPRLALLVDGDRRARREAELRAVLQTAKHVRHVPIRRPGGARDRCTALHVLGIDLGAAVHIGADDRASDRADRRGHVVAAAAADLVTEHASEHPADDGTGNVGLAFANDLLLL